MTLKEFYDIIGGNYNEARERLLNEKLMKRFVLEFLNDKSYESLKDAVKNGNIEQAFIAAHTLKGVSANLSFAKLCKVSSELTEQLRPKTSMCDSAFLEAVDGAYKEVVTNISQIDA